MVCCVVSCCSGEWPKEEGAVIGVREGVQNEEEIKKEVGKGTEEKTGKKRIREEEKEENETVIVRRRCS